MSIRQDGLHISQRTVENLGDRIGMFLYAKIPTQIKTQTDTIKNDTNHEKGGGVPCSKNNACHKQHIYSNSTFYTSRNLEMSGFFVAFVFLAIRYVVTLTMG